MVFNIALMLIIMYFAPSIATYIVKNDKTLPTIYALALLCPLVFLSGILKGYCIGLNKVEISSYSQISEEIARIIFIGAAGSYFVSQVVHMVQCS
jgi:stage V sporulation protein B